MPDSLPVVVVRGLAIVSCLIFVPAAAAADLQFNRDVRPILAEHCFSCHGPDKMSRKADLRLDQREVAVESKAIVPGKPQESQLWARIHSTDADEVMPPPNKKRLTDAQKETLRQWIAAGAEYQSHWAFLPAVRPALPTVKNEAWVRSDLDRFVLATLERHGLTPAPEADLRTLARRASLDLRGLPPTVEEVDELLRDKTPQAYENYLDRLLKSPAWGEHRARYWLDVARYADTHGIHFDNYREMWAFRDWVIGAFNRNLPFDQFTIEQLAGDLLPNPSLDQVVASGFNRCNITTNEGGTIAEEYLVLYTRDRTETVGQAWLGLTVGCAVCHEHKFDPVTQQEFYELAAFFNNTTQPAMDGNRKDTPPILSVPQVTDRARWQEITRELPQLRQQITERSRLAHAEFDRWLPTATPEQITTPVPTEGLTLQAGLSEGQGKRVAWTVGGTAGAADLTGEVVWEAGQVAQQALKFRPDTQLQWDDAGNFERDNPWTIAAWVYLPNHQGSGSLLARMDDQHDFRGWDVWVEQGKVGMHVVHKWPGDALKVVTGDPLPVNAWNHLLITYDGSSKAAGVKIFVNGEERTKRIEGADVLRSTIKTTVPLKVAQRHSTARVQDLKLQDLRIYSRVLATAEILRLSRDSRTAWLLAKPHAERTDAEKKELFTWWLPSRDEMYRQLTAKQTVLAAEEDAIAKRGTMTHVMQERTEKPKAFVLFRGEYDQRRAEVQASTPSVLPAMPPELPRNRLGLAQWLLRPENPLTARVTVNRFWQELFGTGLVRTAGDFGAAGELPSHPELLDWLAVDFREHGWDMKRFYKQMLLSATYRQSALATREKLEKDAQNRWLSRGPRFRMDGEMVRDYALSVSDLLVRKMGGPSVKPYQPDGVWEAVAMIGSNTRDYRRDTGESLYRRSLYTFWKRSAPPASLEIFNAPNRETCVVRRERTNTPLQALVTLNDPQFIEAARHVAQITMREGGATAEERLNFVAQRLLARPWSERELPIVRQSWADLETFYKSHGEDAKQLIAVGESKPDEKLDPADLAAWTMLVNQVLNLDEVLTK